MIIFCQQIFVKFALIELFIKMLAGVLKKDRKLRLHLYFINVALTIFAPSCNHGKFPSEIVMVTHHLVVRV